MGAAVSLKTELVRAAVWFHGGCSDRAAGRRRDVFMWFFWCCVLAVAFCRGGLQLHENAAKSWDIGQQLGWWGVSVDGG